MANYRPGFDLECKFHVWQMNDGRWHVSPYTEHRNTVPLFRSEIDCGFETDAEAQAALRTWAAKVENGYEEDPFLRLRASQRLCQTD